MAKPNYKQIYAIDKKNKEQLLKVNPNLNDKSGIYFLTREDENGFRFGYIGQAHHILSRLSQHLSGYQRIDISLKAHKLYSEDNPYGWKVNFMNFPESELDEKEQFYIKEYATHGYQLRNLTSGSQGVGKAKIGDYKPAKGYRDGLAQGEKNLAKKIKHLFDKHLDVKTKSDPPTRYQQDALEKFKELIDTEDE